MSKDSSGEGLSEGEFLMRKSVRTLRVRMSDRTASDSPLDGRKAASSRVTEKNISSLVFKV